MKIGPERPRLSVRLQALQEASEAQAKTSEAAALMASTLESFKLGCENSLKSAADTMKADTQILIDGNRHAIAMMIAQIRCDLDLIHRLTQFGPWVVAITLMTLIVSIFAASWYWESSLLQEMRDNSLAQIGITAFPTRGGMVLSWEPTKLKLNECRSGSQTVPCLTPIGGK